MELELIAGIRSYAATDFRGAKGQHELDSLYFPSGRIIHFTMCVYTELFNT